MSSIDQPAVPGAEAARSSSHPDQRPQLRVAAMSLPSVVMQCVGQIGPALGVLLTVPYIVGLTGAPGAFAFLLGFVLMLTAAVPLAYLARELPSAGGYYTYLSRTLHPRVGFLASWAWALYSPAAGAFSFSVLGYLLHNTLASNYGINYPWWVTVIVGAALIAVIGWRDVRVSGRALIIFSCAEMAIMLLLSVWGLSRPGPGGFSLAAFDPARSFSATGLYLGVTFSIFALTGWEGAAPAAEECQNPRRAIPLALIGSVILTGLFFVFVTWGLTVGWGTHRAAAFGSSIVSPAIVLAQRYWSGAWILVLIATVNSAFAVAVASSNVSTRMWFAMARSGSLPRQLARVHPVHKTPSNAVLLQTALTLIIGLGVGFWIGPANEFFLFGLALTVVMVIVYALGNIGVFRYFWLARHPGRKLLVHVILPLVSTLMIAYVGYKSLVPLPAMPVGLAPVVVGAWTLVGVALLIAMRIRGREGWLLRSSRAMNDLADEPD